MQFLCGFRWSIETKIVLNKNPVENMFQIYIIYALHFNINIILFNLTIPLHTIMFTIKIDLNIKGTTFPFVGHTFCIIKWLYRVFNYYCPLYITKFTAYKRRGISVQWASSWIRLFKLKRDSSQLHRKHE